jgi:hypothetical protein
MSARILAFPVRNEDASEGPQTRSSWTPSFARAHAHQECPRCAGTGLKRYQPCACVVRNIVSEVVGRLTNQDRYATAAHGFAHIDYAVDVESLIKRSLDSDEYKLFEQYILNHIAPARVMANLALTYAEFYNSYYRIEMKLGRAVVEEKLYPFGLYNQPGHVTARTVPVAKFVPVRPPLSTQAPAVAIRVPAAVCKDNGGLEVLRP